VIFSGSSRPARHQMLKWVTAWARPAPAGAALRSHGRSSSSPCRRHLGAAKAWRGAGPRSKRGPALARLTPAGAPASSLLAPSRPGSCETLRVRFGFSASSSSAAHRLQRSERGTSCPHRNPAEGRACTDWSSSSWRSRHQIDSRVRTGDPDAGGRAGPGDHTTAGEVPDDDRGNAAGAHRHRPSPVDLPDRWGPTEEKRETASHAKNHREKGVLSMTS
jgi:hypothetical protein